MDTNEDTTADAPASAAFMPFTRSSSKRRPIVLAQIRIYTINKGELARFVAEWQEKIRPLREKLGFRIVGAWTVEASNQFVWVQQYQGDKTWEEQDQAYFASDERKAMLPDPARLIARMETYFADQVL
jgi:hypothetical protein